MEIQQTQDASAVAKHITGDISPASGSFTGSNWRDGRRGAKAAPGQQAHGIVWNTEEKKYVLASSTEGLLVKSTRAGDCGERTNCSAANTIRWRDRDVRFHGRQ